MVRRRQGYKPKTRLCCSSAKSSGARPSGSSRSTVRWRRASHWPRGKATGGGAISKPSSTRVLGAWPRRSEDGLAGAGEERVGNEEVTTAEDEVGYWRALAEERQRRIEELRALILTAVDTIPDRHVNAFVTALDASHPSWLRELDSMESSSDIQPGDIFGILDDLWRQVAAGSGHR